jgi:D-3-phosphoglycerate dehydrogenase
MKRGVWLINTARGAIVNEPDLIEALRTGRVARAALDVFEEEPLPPDSPLRTLPNVILGSHNSSNTEEAVHRTSGRAIENLLEGLAV